MAIECQMKTEINKEEVDVAMRGMKNVKAMGPDGIPVEVWKSLGR